MKRVEGFILGGTAAWASTRMRGLRLGVEAGRSMSDQRSCSGDEGTRSRTRSRTRRRSLGPMSCICDRRQEFVSGCFDRSMQR